MVQLLFCKKCDWNKTNVGMKPICPICSSELYVKTIPTEDVEKEHGFVKSISCGLKKFDDGVCDSLIKGDFVRINEQGNIIYTEVIVDPRGRF